jgi:hypothetical protein
LGWLEKLPSEAMSESVVYDVICGFSALLMSAKWRRRARAAGGRVGGDVEVIDAEDSREPGVGARRPETTSAFGLTAASQPAAMIEVFVHFA